MRQRLITSLIMCAACALTVSAQDDADKNKLVVTGSIQSDVLIPQEDTETGAVKSDDWALTNSYAEVNVMSKYMDGGARLEFLEHPLPGYERDFKGWGVPFYYVKGKFKNVEVTVGSFYEQFGSGFIFRTYEERSLGIDNHLLGGKVVYRPYKGIQLKALTGEQRYYWEHNDSWISGADVELNIDEWSKAMQESGTRLMVGVSYVNKHEKEEDVMVDATHKLNFPTFVNAFDVRAQLQKGPVSVLAEYAQKSQDPCLDNGYIYRKGYVAMLSASYSRRGMSILAQAKRTDNMAMRSQRSRMGISSFINHMPAFTMEHTYALAAIYPYATQLQGEWAYQVNAAYNFKRKTPLGGKYGTLVKVNYSYVHAIDQHNKAAFPTAGTDGYHSAFWKWGDQMYYQDLNVQVEKKITRDFKLNLMVMNQFYNQQVVEGHGSMIHSNIFVAEGKYNISPKTVLRAEAQYLYTKAEEGEWVYGLVELSLTPHWMFTASDMYNCSSHIHYYQGLATFNYGPHRVQLGYGRTRAGYNCAGGVCRYVPATRGLTLAYHFNF